MLSAGLAKSKSEAFRLIEQGGVAMVRFRVHPIQRDSKKTVVFVTHSIPEAVYLSDRVVVMTRRPGRISQIIDVATVRKAEQWDRLERVEDVMDQPSFVHLRTAIWRLLREQQQPGDH